MCRKQSGIVHLPGNQPIEMRLSLSGPENSKQQPSMSFRLDHPSLTNSVTVTSVHLDRGDISRLLADWWRSVTVGTHGWVHKRRALRKTTVSPPNMPPPTVTQNRLENMVICLSMTTNTLQIIADSMKTPFLGAIINTTQAVLKNIQVSSVEDTCINMKLSHSRDCYQTQRWLCSASGANP
jgi:hypothetical protein